MGRMKFAYEDLSDDQFEVLIVLLCQRLLGIAVQGFAKGRMAGVTQNSSARRNCTQPRG